MNHIDEHETLSIPTNCQRCGGKLVYIPWNTHVDVAFCDDVDCPKYRQPISIPLGAHKGEVVKPAKNPEPTSKIRDSVLSLRERLMNRLNKIE